MVPALRHWLLQEGLPSYIRHHLISSEEQEVDLAGLALRFLFERCELSRAAELISLLEEHADDEDGALTPLWQAAVEIAQFRGWRVRDELLRVAGDSMLSGAQRWIARMGCAHIALMEGKLRPAEAHVLEAQDLARELNEIDHMLCSCLLARVEAAQGHSQRALQRLDGARSRASELPYDPTISATLSMARAEVFRAAEMAEDALSALQRAHRADPAWGRPTTELAVAALARGDVDFARQLLEFVDPRCAHAAHLRAGIELVREQKLHPWVIYEYLSLREAPASEQRVAELRALCNYSPHFPLMQQTLAWKLMELGELHLARPLFTQLTSAESAAESEFDQETLTVPIPPELMEVGLGPEDTTREHAIELHVDAGVDKELSDAFSGDLSLLPPFDLIDFLHLSERSGLLAIEGEDGAGEVRFHSGRIIGASSPRHPEVEGEQSPATEMQCIDALKEMGGWAEGRFVFRSLPALGVPPVEGLDARSALLQACQALDERARWRPN